MKQENPYREPWIESLIERQPDGLLHTEKEQGKQRGRPSHQNPNRIEIEICLSCTLEQCELDTKEYCKHMRREKKKRKRGEEDSQTEST